MKNKELFDILIPLKKMTNIDYKRETFVAWADLANQDIALGVFDLFDLKDCVTATKRSKDINNLNYGTIYEVSKMIAAKRILESPIRCPFCERNLKEPMLTILIDEPDDMMHCPCGKNMYEIYLDFLDNDKEVKYHFPKKAEAKTPIEFMETKT